MKRRFPFIILAVIALYPLAGMAASSPHIRLPDIPLTLIHKGSYPVCGNYRIKANEIIKFNPNELKLICGDSKVDAWKTIPKHQAIYNIKNFLQDKGYFYPTFEERDDATVINVGEKTLVKKIILTGTYPKNLKNQRMRGVRNAPLTPGLLTSFDNWVTARLGNIGYPCADVKVTADAHSGSITAHIESGEKYDFPVTEIEPIKEFDSQVLRRYHAFKEGKPFNQQLLTLTSRRTETNGIVQNTYFVPKCEPEGVSVTQKSASGKPRLFIFGIGADTEEIVKGKISWKHSRLGKNASSIKLEAMASYRKQIFNANSNWYVFDTASRWYLAPSVTFERRYERHYNYISTDVGLFPSVTWDGQYVRLIFNIGPDLNFKKTYRGANPGVTKFLSALMRFSIISHNYEFYNPDPREGYTLNLIANLNSRDIFSSVTAEQFQMYGEWLLNIANFDPALFIIGLRGGANTTLTKKGSPYFNNLPPDFLFYLGGSRDLRGFKRQELPLTYRGALTSAFASIEARLVNVFPFNLQPIAFVDFGVLGEKSLKFDRPVYWSPGFGARLYSMIGVFRATLAHGFMIGNKDPGNNKASHWQFYFSYGEEF